MSNELYPIPGPARRPFVGNLLQIPKGRMSAHMLALSREYGGIFELDFGGIRVPFVSSAALAGELCDENRFRKVIRPPLSLLRKMVGDGLFTAHSNQQPWGKAHRVLMPAFSQRAMKSYFDAMLEVAEQLSASWEARAGQDILVADDMTRLTLDTISLAGFGYRFNSFEQAELHPFLGAMVRVLSHTMSKLTRLPLLNRISKDSPAFLRDIEQMNSLVDEVIRSRRDQPVDTADLLNLMLHAEDPETGERLDDVNIRHQVLTFLVAGHETTSGLLTFAIYLLLRHPHVLAQAYAEVDQVLPGDVVPEYRHLARLGVIERVLKETLRLWPTAPAITVAPYQDTVIGGRYLIRKDQTVSIQLPALHRDPAVWENPDSFDIDRFLPEREAAIHPHAYKPFGNGERACIGRQFALTEAKLALAMVLQRFALSDPYDYRLEIKETLTLKPDNFRIRVKRRAAHERVHVTTPESAAPRPQPAANVQGGGEDLCVAYGSSLGTARDIAEQLAEQARRLGFNARCRVLDDFADGWPQQGLFIAVTATYNGRAPDGARRIEELLDGNGLPGRQCTGLRYAVLGCGNSQWRTYQAFPKRIDAALAEAGAQPVVPRGEADGNGDLDGAVETWLAGLWKALGEQVDHASGGEAPVEVTVLSGRDTRARVLPAEAHAMEVLGNRELVRDPSGLWDFTREAPRGPTRHLELRLPEGVRYRAGDHLMVYPGNPQERVAAAAGLLGLATTDVVVLEDNTGRSQHLPLGRPVSIGQLFGSFIELQEPISRRQLRRLAAFTHCPHTQAELQRLSADTEQGRQAFRTEVADRRLSLLDVLERHPAIQIPLQEFLGLCPALRPRFYSISSSALTSPDTVSLTVGTVEGPAWSGRGHYRGVASSFLAGLQPGDEVIGYVSTPSPTFAPQTDTSTPMILIGPGTGIAPFRGFLEERMAQQETGADVAPSLLFHGCRHPDHDWLYRQEMETWRTRGLVDLHMAYSCVEEHPHRYVQDALWAAREDVWAALQEGATIYVCGDGSHMAPAVRDCLIRIHQDRTGSNQETSSAWLEDMVTTERYRQDVFGPV